MGNAMPSHSDVSSLIPHDGGNLYDIIVIGMQEATFGGADDIARGMEEEEEEGDGKVGKVGGEGKKPHLSQKGKRFSAPSIVGKVGKVVRKVEETFRGVTSTSDTSYNKFTPQNRKGAAFSFDSPSPSADSTALHSMLSSHLPSYSPCVRYQRGEMRLHIYVRTALVPALTDVEVAAENTGIGHLLANKGGIAARITFTDTSLSFVTCHIQAHEGKEHFQRRCTDLSEILAGTKLGNPKRYDVSLISHHTFVFGDLNFRTDYGKGKKENKEICWKALARGDFQDIYNHDELMRAVCNGECLTGFQEGDCSTFPPTFKVNRHVRGSLGEGLSVEDIYNPQRTPSYCDRILYTSLAGLDGRLKQVKLEAVPSYAASDHNPVRSMFHIDVPTIDKFGLHFPSALMSRRPKEESELRARNSPSKVDSARIVRDLSETPDFDLDHPTLTSEKVENEDEQEADVDYDRICKLTFFDMRCRNLTEMDPSITGGGSDPYIQFVPLSDHLLKGQHKSHRRNTTNHAFSHFARTATHRKNVNPVFDDVVELEIDLSREKDLMIGKFIALTVMDHDDLSEDDLIGTVVINLASLVGGDGGNGVRLRREKGGTSRIEVSKPVMRDCMVQGHLECTVEMCWMDGKMVRTTRSKNFDRPGECCSLS